MKKQKRSAPLVIRPKKKHPTLLADLKNLAESKNDNLNNYAENILYRHTLRMAQPDIHEGE